MWNLIATFFAVAAFMTLMAVTMKFDVARTHHENLAAYNLESAAQLNNYATAAEAWVASNPTAVSGHTPGNPVEIGYSAAQSAGYNGSQTNVWGQPIVAYAWASPNGNDPDPVFAFYQGSPAAGMLSEAGLRPTTDDLAGIAHEMGIAYLRNFAGPMSQPVTLTGSTAWAAGNSFSYDFPPNGEIADASPTAGVLSDFELGETLGGGNPPGGQGDPPPTGPHGDPHGACQTPPPSPTATCCVTGPHSGIWVTPPRVCP